MSGRGRLALKRKASPAQARPENDAQTPRGRKDHANGTKEASRERAGDQHPGNVTTDDDVVVELSGTDSGGTSSEPQSAPKRQRCNSGPAAGSGGKAGAQKAVRVRTQPSLLPRTSQPAATSASASDSGGSGSSASESASGSVFSAASTSSSGGTSELSEVADSQEELCSAQKPAKKAVQEPQASPTRRLPLPAGPDHFPHADAKARKAAPAAKAAPQAAKGAAQAGGGRAGGAPGTARRGAAAKAPAGAAAKAAANTPAPAARSGKPGKPGGTARKLGTPCAASAPAATHRTVLAPCSNGGGKGAGSDAPATAAPCARSGAQGVTPAGRAKAGSAAGTAQPPALARAGAPCGPKGVAPGAKTHVAQPAAPASSAGAGAMASGKAASAACPCASPAVTPAAVPGGSLGTMGALGALPSVRFVGLMRSAPRSGGGLGGVRLPGGSAFRVPGLRRSAPGGKGLHRMSTGNQ